LDDDEPTDGAIRARKGYTIEEVVLRDGRMTEGWRPNGCAPMKRTDHFKAVCEVCDFGYWSSNTVWLDLLEWKYEI
jgi:hypothetical protein